MRLTDHPRKLADVRPDIAWPEPLQSTLDRALARDADDRYQSAAQFGRDFAAAIAAMPATQAVDARTMMVNAVATAKDEVPATRMAQARPSAKTLPIEAPVVAKKSSPAAARPVAAEKSGSKVPMLAGVGGGVAVMVGVGLYMAGIIGPKAEPGAALSGTDTTAGSTQQPPQVGLGAPATSVPDAAAAQKTADSIALLARPAGRTTRPPAGNNTKVPPTPTGSPATVASTTALLRAWIRELDTGDPDSNEGARILREVNQNFDRFSGEEIADGWFVRMQAYASMEDARTCEAAREVKSRSSDPTKRLKADEYLRAACS